MEKDARRRLEDVLDREIAVARALAATLAAERTALTGDSAQAVEQQAAEKIEILGTIEKLETERRGLCADGIMDCRLIVARAVRHWLTFNNQHVSIHRSIRRSRRDRIQQ